MKDPELLDLLYTVLPFLEDAEDDPCYKDGRVTQLIARLRKAIAQLEADEPDVIQIDSYQPDYSRQCEVCGADHVVTGVKDGKVVYRGDMCGVCTWGEAAMLDPAKWNE